MLWFDHSIWFIVNNLHMFFPDATYPSLPSKFGAFLTWMKSAARLAVRTHITFLTMRRLMEVAALEYATDPSQKLLAKYYDAPGARKIERLFKPAAFSTDTTPTPPQKRRRLNMNVAPVDTQPGQNRSPSAGRGQFGRGNGRGGAHTGGRGNYNKNDRSPSGFQIFSNSRHEFQASAGTSNSELSRVDRSSSSNQSIVLKPWPPIKGRVLNWDDA
jgi:hypothetical protein